MAEQNQLHVEFHASTTEEEKDGDKNLILLCAESSMVFLCGSKSVAPTLDSALR